MYQRWFQNAFEFCYCHQGVFRVLKYILEMTSEIFSKKVTFMREALYMYIVSHCQVILRTDYGCMACLKDVLINKYIHSLHVHCI